MEALTAQQMQQLLVFIEHINQNCEHEALPWQLLSALTELIPGDCVSYNLFNYNLEMEMVVWDPVDTSIKAEDQLGILREHVSEHAFMSKFAKDGRLPATSMTDVFSQRRIRQSGIYHELYRPLGIEYQLGIGIPAPDNKHLVMTQNRGCRNFNQRDKLLLQVASAHIANRLEFANKQFQLSQQLRILRDFSSADAQGLVILSINLHVQWMNQHARELMDRYFQIEFSHDKKLPTLLRVWLKQQQENLSLGHSTQAFFIVSGSKELTIDLIEATHTEVSQLLRIRERYRDLPSALSERFSLTPREAEVLDWLVKGKTNIETALLLFITPATVKKHLEHIYDKLGVCNRTAAVGKVHRAIQ